MTTITRDDVAAPHEMDEMGAHGDEGTVWLPRSLYPTREAARTWFANFTGIRWIECRVYARWAVHSPNHPAAGEYEGEYWTECPRTTQGAFRVWRCE